MKLRIRGDSLRLRLTRTEVMRAGAGESVEEAIRFGIATHERLIYRLVVSTEVNCIVADYAENCITIRLPFAVAREWAATNRITLEAAHALDGNAQTDASPVLKIIIEKDFACLTEGRGAEDADTFPHPLEGALRC